VNGGPFAGVRTAVARHKNLRRLQIHVHVLHSPAVYVTIRPDGPMGGDGIRFYEGGWAMRRVTGWWIMIPVALLLFGFIFAAGSASVSAQASPGMGQLGAGSMGQQQVSTVTSSSTAAAAPTGNPFVFVLPTQPVATGPGGIVYPQYSPRRLRDG